MKKIMTMLIFLFFVSSANAAEPLVESSWLKKKTLIIQMYLS